jgi:hypothetical protein
MISATFGCAMPKSLLSRLLTPLLLLTAVCASAVAKPSLNELVLEQIKAMPRGGNYSASHLATLRLADAAHFEQGKFFVMPDAASPSYCSGATYLVFLKVLEKLRNEGGLKLDDSVLEKLVIRGQPDGFGIWGRWNANGPGTARLFHELQLGSNFVDFDSAKPGDFMKIFWTHEIGAAEHGHSVIFLGSDGPGGDVRFWSSNIPAGYGEKSVPRTKIAFAIFSRLEVPENLANAGKLPNSDKYLAGLTAKRSSVAEAKKQCGF